MKVEGTVAIITGGSSGFGKALAERYTAMGGKVVLGDINDKQGFHVVAELNKEFANSAIYQHCNVAKKKDIEGLFSIAYRIYGRVDVMVNNAGIPEDMEFTENVNDTWLKVIDIDVNSVILGTRIAITEFTKRKTKGVILNVGSLAGLNPVAKMSVYAGAKAAVVNFSRSLRYISESHDIRVNVICPGFTKTALTDEIHNNKKFEIKDWVPIERVIDAFILGIEDDSLAGDVIRVTKQKGIDLPYRRKLSRL